MLVADSVGLVTGGASGIGEGIATMLVEGGGRVVIVDRNAELGAQVAARLGDRAVFADTDVTDTEQVAAAVELARSRFGRLDVVVNCAGISPAARLVNRRGEPFPMDIFRRGIEVNLIGPFDVMRQGAALMAANEPSEEGERGLVVNVSSTAAFEGQVGQAAYTASKGGLAMLTLCAARDLSDWGIRVMTICPGTIDTPMVRAASQEIRDYLQSANLFPKRFGKPSDIADVVRTCMQTTYLNGDIIRVDAAVRLAPR